MSDELPFALRQRGTTARPQAGTRRVAGYLRVSTDEQSTDPQRADVEACFRTKLQPRGLVWGDTFEDVGVSAKVEFLRRPEGFRMSQWLEPGDVAVFAKLDRAFRDVVDCLTVAKTWKARGVEVHILDLGEGAVADTEVGELHLTMMAAFARFERRRISTRTKEALAVRKAQGRPWGGNPPWGYRKVGKAPNTYLVRCEQTRRDAAQFLAWQREGWSYHQMFAHCLREGVICPRTGRPWRSEAIEEATRRELRMQAEEKRIAELRGAGPS